MRPSSKTLDTWRARQPTRIDYLSCRMGASKCLQRSASWYVKSLWYPFADKPASQSQSEDGLFRPSTSVSSVLDERSRSLECW